MNQIDIAQTMVNTILMGAVGAMALAAGLAFGLGGRDTAGEMVKQWSDRAKSAAPKLELAADKAVAEADSQASRGVQSFRTGSDVG